MNAEPLEIDLLVIKKEASAQIVSDIGKVFKGHNIIEYKSLEDIVIEMSPPLVGIDGC